MWKHASRGPGFLINPFHRPPLPPTAPLSPASDNAFSTLSTHLATIWRAERNRGVSSGVSGASAGSQSKGELGVEFGGVSISAGSASIDGGAVRRFLLPLAREALLG